MIRQLVAVIWMLVATATAATAAPLPSIMVVLFDDLGYGEPGCYRPESRLKTPRLDAVAAAGIRFTDAHSASAVCTPTRYGLLTGRAPCRIGQYGVLTTFDPPLIPESRLTVASLLKRHGYQTACIGKWHLGLTWQAGIERTGRVVIGSRITSGPTQLGFDTFYGFTHARAIETIVEQDRVVEHVAAIENQPRMIAKAVDWLEQRDAGTPFFLYFPMCPPHTPVVPAPEFVGRSGAVDDVARNPTYGDWVYQGDFMLGQLLDALDRTGRADDTLVIAASDNGADGRVYPPLRGRKAQIHEGGHRVPFVARWPGRIAPGTVSEQTICLNDLLATCAEIVGERLPDDAGEDSVSILPALTGVARKPLRDITVHQSASGELAIRHGPWKLVFPRTNKRVLYDLATDLGETRDVADDHPEVVEQLTALMKRTIADGRSTPGAKQPVDSAVKWPVP